MGVAGEWKSLENGRLVGAGDWEALETRRHWVAAWVGR
jgi:hypothetical protein